MASAPVQREKAAQRLIFKMETQIHKDSERNSEEVQWQIPQVVTAKNAAYFPLEFAFIYTCVVLKPNFYASKIF